MLQNVKVDIIYYQTNTDFEMEFNLGGCCNARTLRDTAEDRKGLIKLLARAVSRSRIIMVCGGLFSETGLIEIVSAAISKETACINNETYGIKSDQKINIISGSTPLVTPEGYFGGCIIESGPQTIVLLTENKGIRKTIMKNLIHPYLEAYTLQVANNDSTIDTRAVETVMNENENTEEPVLESAEPEEENTESDAVIEAQESEVEENSDDVDAPEIAEEEKIEEIKEDFEDRKNQDAVQIDFEQDEIGFVFEEEVSEASEQMPEVVEISEDDVPMHLEPEKVKYSKTSYYEIEYTSSDEDKMFISDSLPVKKPPTFNVPIIILACIVVLLLCVIAYFLIVTPLLNGQSFDEYFNEIFSSEMSVIKVLKH